MHAVESLRIRPRNAPGLGVSGSGAYAWAQLSQSDVFESFLKAEPAGGGIGAADAWFCCASVDYSPLRPSTDEQVLVDEHGALYPKHPAQKQLVRFAVPAAEPLRETFACLLHAQPVPLPATAYVTPGFFCFCSMEESFPPRAIPWEQIVEMRLSSVLTVASVEFHMKHGEVLSFSGFLQVLTP